MFRVITIFLLSAIFSLPHAAAQEQPATENTSAPVPTETLPNTPRELENFRLDRPEPAAPNLDPVTLPPAETTTSPPQSASDTATQPDSNATTPPPSTQSRGAQRPVPARARRNALTPAQASPVAPAGEVGGINENAVTETAAPPADNEIVESPSTAEKAAETSSVTDSTASFISDWRLWAFLAALLGTFAVFFYWLGSRRKAPEPEQVLDSMIPDMAPPEDIMDEDHAIAIDGAKPTREAEAPIAKPKIRPPARPQLEMRFEPDQAMLGLAKLTLRGELHIVNHGKAMARNVRLRTAAICACESQDRLIKEFYAGGVEEDASVIDNIRKGERVTVNMEVSLPRTELLSYHVQDRQICVPIMLAELCWSGMRADSGDKIEITALIGTESDPPNDKMGPLRLDLGPRSFGSLGQRLLTV